MTHYNHINNVSSNDDSNTKDDIFNNNKLINEILKLDPNNIIGTHKPSNIQLTVKDLNTLNDGKWINDNIMNVYLSHTQNIMIHICNKKNINCNIHILNTYFFTKLLKSYDDVKRWTGKNKFAKKGFLHINSIFDLDKLIIPVNIDNKHWLCGCIDFKNKSIQYFDSINIRNSSLFFKTIQKYLINEFEDKLNNHKDRYDLDLTQWTQDNNCTKYPKQKNGTDCGAFTLICAEKLLNNLSPFNFSQNDIPGFRYNTIQTILRSIQFNFNNINNTIKMLYRIQNLEIQLKDKENENEKLKLQIKNLNNNYNNDKKKHCTKCGKCFDNGRKLGGHIARVHSEITIEKRKLKLKLKLKHENRKWKCNYCDKEFINPYSFGGHKGKCKRKK